MSNDDEMEKLREKIVRLLQAHLQFSLTSVVPDVPLGVIPGMPGYILSGYLTTEDFSLVMNDEDVSVVDDFFTFTTGCGPTGAPDQLRGWDIRLKTGERAILSVRLRSLQSIEEKVVYPAEIRLLLASQREFVPFLRNLARETERARVFAEFEAVMGGITTMISQLGSQGASPERGDAIRQKCLSLMRQACDQAAA